MSKIVTTYWHLLKVLSDCEPNLYKQIISTISEKDFFTAVKELFHNIGFLNFEIPVESKIKLESKHKIIEDIIYEKHIREILIRERKLVQLGLVVALKHLEKNRDRR